MPKLFVLNRDEVIILQLGQKNILSKATHLNEACRNRKAEPRTLLLRYFTVQNEPDRMTIPRLEPCQI